VSTVWISRLSLSAGARLRFGDLAPAEGPFLAREELTGAPKAPAAKTLRPTPVTAGAVGILGPAR
jgi:hypothetical protein